MRKKRDTDPGPPPTSGALAEHYIIEGILSNEQIAERVRAVYPRSKMTKATVRWYRWNLRRRGELSVS